MSLPQSQTTVNANSVNYNSDRSSELSIGQLSPKEQAAVGVLESKGPEMISNAVARAASGESDVEVESTGFGVSCLKQYPKFTVSIVNTLFTSDMLRNIMAWANTANTSKFQRNLGTFGSNMRRNIQSSLRNKEAQCAIAGDTPLDDQTLATALDYVIKNIPSSLIKGRKDAETGQSTKESKKFTELSSWTESVILPRQHPIREFYTLTDLYVITALKDVFDKAITNNSNFSTPKHELAIQLLETMKSTATAESARGESALTSIEAAQAIIRERGESIFTSAYMNYDSSIPAGSHLAYEFSGGALHHAIYIGSNVLVEVFNGNTQGLGAKIVQGFILISHLYDFLKRTRNNASGLYIYKYTNPYPVDLIKARALWALGKFEYHITESNCESFANWVSMNSYIAEMCTLTKGTILRQSSKKVLLRRRRNKTRKQ
jgi:hypothetical protein